MIFAFLLYDFAKHRRVGGDGLLMLGIGAFLELVLELMILAHKFH